LSYNHYTVTSSIIRVTFRNLITNTCTVNISVLPDATPITVFERILEFGMNSTRNLEPKGVQGAMAQLEALVSIKKLNGVKDLLDDPIFRGDAVSNPTEQSYFHVQVWDSVGAASGSVQCDVTLEANVVFTEPRVLTLSTTQKLKQLFIDDSDVKVAEKPPVVFHPPVVELKCEREVTPRPSLDDDIVHVAQSGFVRDQLELAREEVIPLSSTVKNFLAGKYGW